MDIERDQGWGWAERQEGGVYGDTGATEMN